MVSEALERLSADQTLLCHEMGFEDGRLTVFLPVRAPDASLVGVAMVLADGKSLGDDTHERIAAQPVRAILMRLAVLMKPAEQGPSIPRAGEAGGDGDAYESSAEEPLSAQNVNDILEFDLSPEDTGHAHIPQAPADPATPSSDEGVLLEFADEPTQPATTPQASAVAAVSVAAAPPAVGEENEPAGRITSEPVATTASSAPRAAVSELPRPAANDASLLLEILPYAKLRPGGQTRRFQILARIATPLRDPAVQDALVLQRLMSWLASHRSAWNTQPTGFTVSLSIATLEDERFGQKLAAALNSHGIAADSLGFEIAETLCTQRRAHVERFIAQCEKIGAWVVIDSFGFDAQTVPLLRSKALRLVKIDPKLTCAALKDKLSQAMVVAAVQAAKVLGIHCAAQKVDSQAVLQWLTAIGCDFAQGAVLGRAHSLDSIGNLPDTTAVTEHLRTSRAE